MLAFHAYRQFHRQQSEQGSELDHRVHGHRGSVFERISHGIADHGGGVQLGAFLLQLDLHDFLGVVPGPAGVGHEDGLIQAKDGDRDQVADEEERFHEGERQRDKENAEKDVEHPGLRVLGADFNNLFAVGHRRFLHAFQLDVALDEFHRAISAGSHRLHGSAGEPIDDRATAYQPEYKRRVQQREHLGIDLEPVGECHDDGKNHGGGAHHRGSDQHWFGRGLEGIAGAIVGFQQVLGASELNVKVVVLAQLGFDVGDILNERELINGLGVICDRAIRIHGDGHRPHAQKAERHQAESKYRLSHHQAVQPHGAEVVGDGHQRDHGKSQPVGGEIARHQARENV